MAAYLGGRREPERPTTPDETFIHPDDRDYETFTGTYRRAAYLDDHPLSASRVVRSASGQELPGYVSIFPKSRPRARKAA